MSIEKMSPSRVLEMVQQWTKWTQMNSDLMEYGQGQIFTLKCMYSYL